jgi:hypothetical protein
MVAYLVHHSFIPSMHPLLALCTASTEVTSCVTIHTVSLVYTYSHCNYFLLTTRLICLLGGPWHLYTGEVTLEAPGNIQKERNAYAPSLSLSQVTVLPSQGCSSRVALDPVYYIIDSGVHSVRALQDGYSLGDFALVLVGSTNWLGILPGVQFFWLEDSIDPTSWHWPWQSSWVVPCLFADSAGPSSGLGTLVCCAVFRLLEPPLNLALACS